MRDIAFQGGMWTAAQVVANKLSGLLGTIATMYLLAPDQFGIAAIGMSILSYVSLLPAFTLSDVLLARPGQLPATLPTAFRLCALSTATTVALLLVVGWVCQLAYSDGRIFIACVVLAGRSVSELLLFIPQTRLRNNLAFPEMAKIDAAAQLGATTLTMAMAYVGGGYLSLLVPQVIATFTRAVLYYRLTNRESLHGSPVINRIHPWKKLLSDYWLSGLGQYVHGGLIVAPPLIIAAYCNQTTAGWYSTAFALASSLNVVVAVSIGLVLQPVFAKMDNDRRRQEVAFVRACALIATIAMPACLCQAACARSAFALALPPAWDGAIVFVQMMSIGQMFYFAVNPAMGLLKAQGRFGLFFVWQAIQLVVVAGAMVVAGRNSEQPGNNIVAIHSFYHIASSPIGVMLCLSSSDGRRTAIWRIFVAPFVASAACVGTGAALGSLMPDSGLWNLARISVTMLVSLTTYPLVLRTIAPESSRDLKEFVQRTVSRLRPSNSAQSGRDVTNE